jgi:hypothetical protein
MQMAQCLNVSGINVGWEFSKLFKNEFCHDFFMLKRNKMPRRRRGCVA